MERSAVIDTSGMYRYSLGRRWAAGEVVTWIMLNPSTADGNTDDPTIRRCVGFSHDWGFGAMVVVNLYAYRATSPWSLLEAHDPIGPEHHHYFLRALQCASRVVVAWGAHEAATFRHVRPLLAYRPLLCLGTTKRGAPRHPLYVHSQVCPQLWHIPGIGA